MTEYRCTKCERSISESDDGLCMRCFLNNMDVSGPSPLILIPFILVAIFIWYAAIFGLK